MNMWGDLGFFVRSLDTLLAWGLLQLPEEVLVGPRGTLEAL